MNLTSFIADMELRSRSSPLISREKYRSWSTNKASRRSLWEIEGQTHGRKTWKRLTRVAQDGQSLCVSSRFLTGTTAQSGSTCVSSTCPTAASMISATPHSGRRTTHNPTLIWRKKTVKALNQRMSSRMTHSSERVESDPQVNIEINTWPKFHLI